MTEGIFLVDLYFLVLGAIWKSFKAKIEFWQSEIFLTVQLLKFLIFKENSFWIFDFRFSQNVSIIKTDSVIFLQTHPFSTLFNWRKSSFGSVEYIIIIILINQNMINITIFTAKNSACNFPQENGNKRRENLVHARKGWLKSRNRNDYVYYYGNDMKIISRKIRILFAEIPPNTFEETLIRFNYIIFSVRIQFFIRIYWSVIACYIKSKSFPGKFIFYCLEIVYNFWWKSERTQGTGG